jgi:hypothetical protein
VVHRVPCYTDWHWHRGSWGSVLPLLWGVSSLALLVEFFDSPTGDDPGPGAASGLRFRSSSTSVHSGPVLGPPCPRPGLSPGTRRRISSSSVRRLPTTSLVPVKAGKKHAGLHAEPDAPIGCTSIAAGPRRSLSAATAPLKHDARAALPSCPCARTASDRGPRLV